MTFLVALIEIALFGYFLYVTVYSFTLSFSSFFNRKSPAKLSGKKHRMCILIPAYREDGVILRTATEAGNQTYDKEYYDWYVIADGLEEATLNLLGEKQINVINVAFENSTKVRAIRAALKTIKDSYEIIVILDADNIMKEDFLTVLNEDFNNGYRVVQGRRIAKSIVTSIEFLDEVSEQINNSILRKGTCNLGGSAAIAGSGFAVEYKLGTEAFETIDSIGGFDKEIELFFLSHGAKTQYNDRAIIYDEKVRNAETFKNQRRRWISSQFFYLRKFFKTGLNNLTNGNIAFFNSAVLRYAQLPRLLNMGFFSMVVFLIILFQKLSLIPWVIWICAYLVFIISVFIAIPKGLYNRNVFPGMLKLPFIFISMLKVLFQMRGANSKFIHTPHGDN